MCPLSENGYVFGGCLDGHGRTLTLKYSLQITQFRKNGHHITPRIGTQPIFAQVVFCFSMLPQPASGISLLLCISLQGRLLPYTACSYRRIHSIASFCLHPGKTLL